VAADAAHPRAVCFAVDKDGSLIRRSI
jgi:hypothetical protein